MERSLYAFEFHDVADERGEFRSGQLWGSSFGKGFQQRFPALNIYLALRVGSMPVFLLCFTFKPNPRGHQTYFPFYFYPYWAVYMASAISLFFVTLEIFRSVLSAFSGLMRLGAVVFRWVALFQRSLASEYGFLLASQLVMIIPIIALRLCAP